LAESQHNSLYYGSFNANGKERCFRELPSQYRWNVGDEIRVKLDLNRWQIKYYHNDIKVRSAMSLQRNTYFPILCFAGECRYKLN